jgi:hypothetical protein
MGYCRNRRAIQLLLQFSRRTASGRRTEGIADGLSSVAKLYGGWWGGSTASQTAMRGRLWHDGNCDGVYRAPTIWPVVLIGRGLAWIARGLRTPARKALLAEAVTPQTYGRAFGF